MVFVLLEVESTQVDGYGAWENLLSFSEVRCLQVIWRLGWAYKSLKLLFLIDQHRVVVMTAGCKSRYPCFFFEIYVQKQWGQKILRSYLRTGTPEVRRLVCVEDEASNGWFLLYLELMLLWVIDVGIKGTCTDSEKWNVSRVIPILQK